jgi:hypothetical protein
MSARVFVDRRVLGLLDGEKLVADVSYNNPTAMAVSALVVAMTEDPTEPILDTFLEAGGVAACVRLLREMPCSLAAEQVARRIMTLVDAHIGPPKRPCRTEGIADCFFRSGEGLS